MNKKGSYNLSLILMSILFTIAVASCQKNVTTGSNNTTIQILTETIEIPEEGGNGFIAYKSNQTLDTKYLKALCNDDWISDFDYSTPERILFKVKQNDDFSSRETSIKINYPGLDDIKEIKVLQDAATVHDNIITVKVKDVKFDMIFVKGGTFQMGATPEQKPGPPEQNEYPVHEVKLDNYYIGKYEVTQELWEAVMGENPSQHKDGKEYPVENINWYDAENFVKKLNEISDYTFVMPTEAQWEYAARGGNKSKGYLYCGSNDINRVGWYVDNSSGPHKVGELEPNELGLYDMTGNVGEWCRDWIALYTDEKQDNPQGPESGELKVWRGGSFFNFLQYVRPSWRGYCFPDRANDFFGFRLAMEVPE